jgi:hypothetical protein
MDYLVLLDVHYVYFSHFTSLFCTVLSLVIHYKMFKRVKGREEIELRAKRAKEEGKPFGLITWYHLRLSLTYITRQVNCFIITFLHVWNVFSSYS